MSIAIMSQLFKAHLGSTSRKMLAVRLADFADDDGKGIWPTVGRLAQETELSERTVQRILAEFVDEGILVVRAKGGSKPGEATRYDFDLRAIARLKPPKETSDGCHAVTRDTMSPTTPATAMGDTDDADGCHHVTQTVIEPPVEPSDEREAREEGEDRQEPEDPRKVDAAFWEFVKDWPQFGPMGKEPARKLWHAMTADERRLAVARYPGWRKMLKDAKKDHVPTPQTYFRSKLWENVPDPGEAPKPTSTVAGPFGKLWMAYRLSELLLPPTGVITPPTKFEQMQIDQGATTLSAVIAEKRMRSGWPTVNAMLDKARHAQGWICPLVLEEASKAFQQMRPNSAFFEAWKIEHRRRGWPFLDETRLPEWVYFPPIEAEGELTLRAAEAVERYREQISDYLAPRSRGNDDAA